MSFFQDPVGAISALISNFLYAPLPQAWTALIMTLLGGVAVSSFGLIIVIFLIWVERKIAARFQDRLGPNRAGPYGLFQTFADMVKLVAKEDGIPEKAD